MLFYYMFLFQISSRFAVCQWGVNDKWFSTLLYFHKQTKKILKKQLQLSTKYGVYVVLFFHRCLNFSLSKLHHDPAVTAAISLYMGTHNNLSFSPSSAHNLFIYCCKYETFPYEWKIESRLNEKITFTIFTIRINETVFNIK